MVSAQYKVLLCWEMLCENLWQKKNVELQRKSEIGNVCRQPYFKEPQLPAKIHGAPDEKYTN